MFYEQGENRHLRWAYCDPHHITVEELAENFGTLALTNLREGADVATIEAWATRAAHYANVALERQARLHAEREHWRAEGERWRQQDADTKLTDWLGGRQPTFLEES